MPEQLGLLVGQSGGPTAVINASLAGVIAEARAQGYERVLGMRNGVLGALAAAAGRPVQAERAELERLRHTPAAALGSCRYKLQAGDADRLVDIMSRRSGRCVGVHRRQRLGRYGASSRLARTSGGWTCSVVGVPKTIDNDLPATDHCPGYGSAARFVAQVTRETALDTWAMRATDPIRLIEVMGRHAGWLPAAAWLAKRGGGRCATPGVRARAACRRSSRSRPTCARCSSGTAGA